MLFVPSSTFWNKITEYWKVITNSVVSENFSPIYPIVSEKFSSKNSKQRIYELISVLSITEKELKITETAQNNKLFQLLILVCTYDDIFWWVNSYANEQKCKQWRKDAPIQQHVKNSIWSMRSKRHNFSSKGWTNWKKCNEPFISFHFLQTD